MHATSSNKATLNSKGTTQFSALELSVFCYQLSLIFKSGIPMVEGMDLFASQMLEPKFKDIAQDMYESVLNGYSLHETLSRYEGFPPYLISMLHIAESTGKLDVELEHLANHYERIDELKDRIRNALTYPMVLVVLMSAVIILLMVRILPMFQEILASMGGEVPSITQVMLNISKGIQQHIVLLALGLLLIIMGPTFYFRTARGKEKLDYLKLNLPIIKWLYRKVSAARFSQGLVLLVQGGIPLDDALVLVAPIVENKHLEQRILSARDSVMAGNDFEQALRQIDLLPELFIRMLAIGERTGDLEYMLVKINKIYEQEVSRSLQKFTSAVEPALVTALSLVVGVILLTVMLPLIEIMSAVA